MDATAKAHGELVSMLQMDWNILMIQYKAQFCAHLCEEDLPAQSFFEEFEEKLAEGNFETERLTLQTRRRFTSTEPRDIEQLEVYCNGKPLAAGADASAREIHLQ